MASNKITKKDLNEMAVRSMAEQCCFSFERMQAIGFCYGMTKCFRKIHGDNNEEMAAAMANTSTSSTPSRTWPQSCRA